jgi:membrane protein DedA with SNARE-associated domain
MSTVSIAIINVSLALYLIVGVVDFARHRRVRGFVLDLSLVAVGAIAFNSPLASYDRAPAGGQAFGEQNGLSPVAAIALMYVAILLGISARYFHGQRSAFKLSLLLRPLCLSPIVLLPMVGSAPADHPVAPIQLLSLCILAFQNGFFSREMLDRVRKTA